MIFLGGKCPVIKRWSWRNEIYLYAAIEDLPANQKKVLTAIVFFE